jgi:hypothetical protein
MAAIPDNNHKICDAIADLGLYKMIFASKDMSGVGEGGAPDHTCLAQARLSTNRHAPELIAEKK